MTFADITRRSGNMNVVATKDGHTRVIVDADVSAILQMLEVLSQRPNQRAHRVRSESGSTLHWRGVKRDEKTNEWSISMWSGEITHTLTEEDQQLWAEFFRTLSSEELSQWR